MTSSPVHDPTSGGGNVGSTATLGDLSGLASGPTFSMVDGGAYDADKAYKVSVIIRPTISVVVRPTMSVIIRPTMSVIITIS